MESSEVHSADVDIQTSMYRRIDIDLKHVCIYIYMYLYIDS